MTRQAATLMPDERAAIAARTRKGAGMPIAGLIILVWLRAPEWTPFTLAVLFGSHFLPYAWLYQSRAYAVLAIAMVLVSTIAVVTMRDPLANSIPPIVALCYLVAVVLLMRESRALSQLVTRPA